MLVSIGDAHIRKDTSMAEINYRTEHDLLGEREIPQQAY